MDSFLLGLEARKASWKWVFCKELSDKPGLRLPSIYEVLIINGIGILTLYPKYILKLLAVLETDPSPSIRQLLTATTVLKS